MSGRVLVTGSQGFIGTALIPHLRGAGYEVVGYDFSDGDISRDRLAFDDIAHTIHLAAKVYVPDSWKDPLSFYQTNVMGTVNVLELCRKLSCPVTLMSAYIYGAPRQLPIPESAPIDPISPYNHSKVLTENLGAFYAEKFGLTVTILRPFNVYGPGQRGDFLIPSVVHQVLDPAVEVVEVADLEPRRDYLYLDDLVTAIAATLRPVNALGVYNIGSGQSFSVEDVIKRVQAAAGTKKPYRSNGLRRHGEVMDMFADISRASSELGWGPRVPFAEGINRVVAASRRS
jgi:nucleoside-diphosphate-sugar epimerase